MMFKHAGINGARTFDGTTVDTIDFVPYDNKTAAASAVKDAPGLGRPVAATWSRKDGSRGDISFNFLVDASGRAGVVSSKYLKNRKQNEALRHIANWAYWKGTTTYGVGTQRENSPFFEALQGQ